MMGKVAVALLLLGLTAEYCSAAHRSWGLVRLPELSLEERILDAFSTSSRQLHERPPRPEIKSLHIQSNIANRYGNTSITSKVANPANVSQEVSFSVIIPETAFITGFSMEIEGKVYKAYVKEKEEAKKEYAEAVHRGQAAAHVQQSARDSERFSVSVNVEPQSKVKFTLTYEELLQRELGVYRHEININPGQIVPNLKVDVHIKELRNITELKPKEIQSANEIDPNVGENPNAQVEWIQPNEVKIHFEADEKEQRRLEKMRKVGEEGEGVAGQFVIDYDVDRDPSGGQVVVNDGYFVHFFSPAELPPMRKHVLFVLDVSGSMSGRKIEQLQQAMLGILDELKPDDLFNIIEFSYSVTVRNLDAEVNSAVYTPYALYFNDLIQENTKIQVNENTEPFPATPHYIKKAKAIINKMTAGGGTNIYDALKTAIKIAKKGVTASDKLTAVESSKNSAENETSSSTETKAVKMEVPVGSGKQQDAPRPIIIFLTDGEPTVGETSLHKIQSAVNEFNSDPKATLFSLAFGEEADFNFLKKISLANNGFARHIYEAADAQVQLRNFYSQISSPLLSDVKFIYPPDQVEDQTITKRKFSTLFKGSEIVIAGKIGKQFNATDVEAISVDGPIRFQIPITEVKNPSFGSLERLWAYLTIRQLLDEDASKPLVNPNYSQDADKKSSDNSTNEKPTPKQQALKIALKYSFVCPLTSLVVVKPNGTASDLNTESAAPGMENGPIAPMAFQQFAVRSGPMPGSISSGLMVRPPPLLGAGSLRNSLVSQRRHQKSSGRSGRMQSRLKTQTSKSDIKSARPMYIMSGQPAAAIPGAAFSGAASYGGGFPGAPSLTYMPMPSYDMSAMSNRRPIFNKYQPQSHQFGQSSGQPLGFIPHSPMATTLNVPLSTPFDRVDTENIETEDSVDSAEETTSANKTEDEMEAALSKIPWLASIRNGDKITLPTANGSSDVLTLKHLQNSTDEVCSVDNVAGSCLALSQCVTPAVATSLETYVNKYLCRLPGDIAGVCCVSSPTPEVTSVVRTTEMSSTDEETTEEATESTALDLTQTEEPTTVSNAEVTTSEITSETETETSTLLNV